MNQESNRLAFQPSSEDVAADMCATFAERLGRALSDTERSFAEHLFADGSIAVQSWAWIERFEDLVVGSEAIVGDAGSFLARWRRAFSAGYQDLFDPAEALSDVLAIEDMAAGDGVGVRAYRMSEDSKSRFRFKLYHREHAVPLADVLAILEPMGLRALVEEGFAVRPGADGEIWVHEFLVDDPRGVDLVFGDVAREFEAAFDAIWTGRTENDGFNRLVLDVGATCASGCRKQRRQYFTLSRCQQRWDTRKQICFPKWFDDAFWHAHTG